MNIDNIDVHFTIDQLNHIAIPDLKKINAALGLVFDVDFLLISYLAKYEYIDVSNNENITFSQWLLSGDRDPIAELFSYLFTKTDDWDEPFEFSTEELALRKLHLIKIKEYGNASHYFKECSLKLSQSEEYLEKKYFYYIKLIDRLIKN